MQEAIRIQPDLAKEEITVIILKHEESKQGLRRTRRLFSTLNRTAKSTSSGMNIAIDEDDAVAIVTRQLVKESDILKGMVSRVRFQSVLGTISSVAGIFGAHSI